jgi:hypothetical protein
VREGIQVNIIFYKLVEITIGTIWAIENIYNTIEIPHEGEGPRGIYDS